MDVAAQRLIFRGQLLRHDSLLSAYRVEDGQTLHLVARCGAAAFFVGVTVP